MLTVKLLFSAILAKLQQQHELLLEVLILLQSNFAVVFAHFMQNRNVLKFLICLVVLLDLLNQQPIEELLLMQFE